MIEVRQIEGLRLSEIRSKWLKDLPSEDIPSRDLRRLINGAMWYLHRMKLTRSYREYRFIFSKNDKQVMENKNIKICLDLGKIKMKRETTHTYHAFFVKDLVVHEAGGWRWTE